jgi:hypothetical protein
MGTFRDGAQDQEISTLREDAVDDFRRLTELVDVERKRNDLQFARIKALSALCEKLIERLIASGTVQAHELANELSELREVSKPVKR